MKKIVLVALILLLGLAQASWAEDFSSALQSSMKSYPPAVNIAGMGGIWGALPSSYSGNPATSVIFKKYDLKGAVYGSYNLIDFGRGPDFNLYVVDGLTNLGKGVLKIDYFNFDSDKARTKVIALGQYLKGKIKGESLLVGYGYPLNGRLSLGITAIPIWSSDVEFEAEGLGTISKGKSRTRGDFKIGLLYSPLDWLYLGLTYEHSRDKIETTTLTPLSYQKATEYPLLDLIRPGIAIQPWKGGTIGLDWLWGRIDNKQGKKDYEINQWFLGVEQWLTPNFALRAGLADGSPTAGLGIVIQKKLFIDYAWISRTMRDMAPYLGSASTHMVAITFVW